MHAGAGLRYTALNAGVVRRIKLHAASQDFGSHGTQVVAERLVAAGYRPHERLAAAARLWLSSIAWALVLAVSAPCAAAKGGYTASHGGTSHSHAGASQGTADGSARSADPGHNPAHEYRPAPGGHSSSGRHQSNYAADVERDAHGKTKRGGKAKDDFRKQHPCSDTGKSTGPCPGYGAFGVWQAALPCVDPPLPACAWPVPGAVAFAGYLIGATGMLPGKTYACSMAMMPITAAPAMECQNTVRKMGPRAKVRSFGLS